VVTIRLCPFLGSVEILFSPYLFILSSSMENDPLSPPEGEAVQGEHPLDPLFLGYISTLSGIFAIRGMPEQRGRNHEKLELQERLFVSMRILAEPFFNFPSFIP
jgi:hypothetical protein